MPFSIPFQATWVSLHSLITLSSRFTFKGILGIGKQVGNIYWITDNLFKVWVAVG